MRIVREWLVRHVQEYGYASLGMDRQAEITIILIPDIAFRSGVTWAGEGEDLTHGPRHCKLLQWPPPSRGDGVPSDHLLTGTSITVKRPTVSSCPSNGTSSWSDPKD
jgi:hypothetical protein